MSDDQINDKTLDHSPEAAQYNWKAIVKNSIEGGFKGALGTLPGGSVFVEAINAAEKVASERQLYLLETVTSELQIDLEALGQLLASDEGLAELWLRATEAARKVRTKQQIRAFAKVLADATNDAQPISTSNVHLRLIESLEEEHVRVLYQISVIENRQPKPQIPGLIGTKSGVDFTDLITELSDITQIMPILINQLTALALVRSVQMGNWSQGPENTSRYTLTDLGEGLIEFLTS